jgi:hypothetical protein
MNNKYNITVNVSLGEAGIALLLSELLLRLLA